MQHLRGAASLKLKLPSTQCISTTRTNHYLSNFLKTYCIIISNRLEKIEPNQKCKYISDFRQNILVLNFLIAVIYCTPKLPRRKKLVTLNFGVPTINNNNTLR